jgi:hypothetical protein
MTPEMRRYRVGGRQMMDPRNFEFARQMREKAAQGTRLKKGGPVKKKYAAGGEVGEADRPEERGPGGLHYNRYLERMRQQKEAEKQSQPGSAAFERALLNAKKATRGPGAGGSERLAREAAETETARRSRVAEAQRGQRFWEQALDEEGKRINQRRDPTRVEDNGYKKGGAVEEGKDKYPSERSRLEKEAAILRRQRERFDTEQDPTGDRQAIFNRPFVAERPSPFYPLMGRRAESPQRQMEQERSRRQEEANQRIDRARERLDDRITETEGRLSSMGSKENKAAYKKGGRVKKKAGGKVTAKPMGKPVMKKAGGRVAAKPMTKGRKK